tara:strand:- start:247 stop:765 length:519 start_codon:yes stop_codon:yes gene_type:complete
MAGNLEFIKSVEVTSSVSSIDVDNVFTDDYDVYFVTVVGFSTVGTTQTRLYLRYIDSSGTVENGSTYDYATLRLNSNTAFTEAKSTTATYQQYSQIDQEPESSALSFYVFNPFDSSSYTFQTYQQASAAVGGFKGIKGIGVEHTAQSHRGFQILEISTRPFDKGKIFVYGVK